MLLLKLVRKAADSEWAKERRRGGSVLSSRSLYMQVFIYFLWYNLLKYPSIVLYYLDGVQRVTSEHQADSSKPTGQEIFTRTYGLRLLRHG